MTMFVFFCSGWETWGHWGDCSSDRTCGQGIKGRRRTCSNGGKIGVDRYCLGLDNQTTTCQSVSCNGKKNLLFPVSYMKVWNTHNLCFKLCKFDRKRIKRCFTIMNMYICITLKEIKQWLLDLLIEVILTKPKQKILKS